MKTQEKTSNKITEKEFQVLEAILFNEYVSHVPGPNTETWVHIVAEMTFSGRTFSGVVGSLKKKGMIETTEDPRTSIQNIPEATIKITPEGFEAWKEQADEKDIQATVLGEERPEEKASEAVGEPEETPEPVYEMENNKAIKERIKKEQRKMFKKHKLHKVADGVWSNYRTSALVDDAELQDDVYEATKMFIHRRPRKKDYKAVIEVMAKEFPQVKKYQVVAGCSFYEGRIDQEPTGIDAQIVVTTVTQ